MILQLTLKILLFTVFLYILKPTSVEMFLGQGFLVFLAWASSLPLVLKSHHRHQDTNWILGKKWFHNLMYRPCWQPRAMTLGVKALLLLLLLTPGAVAAVWFQPDLRHLNLHAARGLVWASLVGAALMMVVVPLIETLLHQMLGNPVVGIGILVALIAGFYIWPLPLWHKSMLAVGIVCFITQCLFVVDLIRAWHDANSRHS
jgi:hypothetical protein